MLLHTKINALPAQRIAPRPLSSLSSSRRLRTEATIYKSPSSSNAASELDLLQRYTEVVPDTNETVAALSHQGKSLYQPRAATVSCNVISGIVAAGSLGLKPYENAIVAAMNFDRCKGLPEAERAQCKLDKALVNVGTIFSKEVEGRVCTQVEPRLTEHTESADEIVSKVNGLVTLYKENGVPVSKLIFRLPATWVGIQAAKQLEAQGIATQVFLVFSMVQAVAAAQAGVSVVQPSVGRLREWFIKYPNMIRDPYGPRQDAGYMSSTDPGLALVQQMFAYIKKFHPKTKIMATGIRTKDDALALSGVDFLLMPAKVLAELAVTPTTAGYNDGLRAMKTEDEGVPALSPNAAEHSSLEQMPPVTEKSFNAGLDMTASELLKRGLQQQVADAERVLPYFEKSTLHSSSF